MTADSDGRLALRSGYKPKKYALTVEKNVTPLDIQPEAKQSAEATERAKAVEKYKGSKKNPRAAKILEKHGGKEHPDLLTRDGQMYKTALCIHFTEKGFCNR